MKKQKSIKVNILFNSIRTCLTLIFPLITFPYITRILSPEGIGKINFSYSIANYFILLAALGISTYAIREGTKYRDDREKFNDFANQMYSVNIISSIFAYIILMGLLVCVSKFQSYRLLIIIYSIEILFKTLGTEWVYNIYEDYVYITVRSFIFQLVSIIFMFIFVKSSADIYWYVLAQVIASAGSNVLNIINVKKYCKLRFVLSKELISHIKPILIIFSATLATMIYVNSDVTMLGIMTNDKEVGYYTVATKAYKIIKSVLNSIVIVYSARLCYTFVNNKEKYKENLNTSIKLIITLSIPIFIGSLIASKNIILVLSGSEYLKAETAMKVMMGSIIFAVLGSLLCNGVLLPANKENIILKTTSVGACINILLNTITIPKGGNLGAAISTLLSEGIIFFILIISIKNIEARYLEIKEICIHILQCIFASLTFFIVNLFLDKIYINNLIINLVIQIVLCSIFYFVVLLLIHNKSMEILLVEIKKRIKNNRRK